MHRTRATRRAVAAAATAALAATGLTLASQPAAAVSPDVVISEVYGGGGNSGATWRNDFIELYNRGSAAVDLSTWSVQYASSSGSSWQRTDLVGSIPPGSYYLVQEAAGSGGNQSLPQPDASGSIAMAAGSGKVALVTSQSSLTCGTDCDSASGVRDFVGYGAANDHEGPGAAPALSNTTSASRTPVTSDNDNNAADFAAGSPSPQNCGDACAPPPPPPATEATIAEVQGAAHRSPLEGQDVVVEGVVTARSSSGFWMQSTSPDGDVATSEGLFVFRGTAAVGDRVAVEGTVTEFRPGGGNSANLTTTELTSPETTVVSGGNALPAATVIGLGGRVPPTEVIEDDASGNVESSGAFDPANDGIDFYESLEGMRVQVNDAVAVGPTNDFGEIPVLSDDGAYASVRTNRGGIVVRDLGPGNGDHKSGDFNPERVILDDALIPFGTMPAVDVRDRFPGATLGVMDYGFGNFKFLVLAPPTAQDGGLQREVSEAAERHELSVATYNVENLDPSDDTFDDHARLIVNNLRSPDILTIEEVQDNDGATNSGNTDATATWEALIAAIRAAGGPAYDFRDIDPLNNQDGGQPGGNIRVGFLFRTDRGLEFVDRPGGDATTPTRVVPTEGGEHRYGHARLTLSPGRVEPNDPAWEDSRKPLAGEFRYRNKTVFVIANHWASKGGDDPLFGRFQPPTRSSEIQRVEQAKVVAGFVSEILSLDKHAQVIVAGDLNDFDFSPAVQRLVAVGLTDLPATLPLPERYTYVFDGNSQVLDHLLLSPQLAQRHYEYDIVHVNSEFADQVSDHEPQVVRVKL